VAAPVETLLEATYFDTEDLRLAAHGVTLRRRTGGADAGWHLKLPAGAEARTEIGLPLGRATRIVPAALVREVLDLTRGHALVPVAVLRTTRLEQRLVDSEGDVLALLADDVVQAERLAPGEVELSTWREVEVELVRTDALALLDVVTARLEQAGLTRSAAASKLARVLGTDPGRSSVPASLPKRAAGRAVQDHLREQFDDLLERDRGARTDEPDAVHKMRVATRRLRSALATFRPLLDRTKSDPVRDELTWLAGVLGASRDAEVMHGRLASLAESQPSTLLLGPVRARIDRELSSRHRDAHASVVTALDSRRYLRLLDTLDTLVEEPPWSERANLRAREELPRLVRRAVRRVDRAAGAVEAAPTPAQRAHRLHRVRKDAKRARYAAESVSPVVGVRASRLAKRMEAVQEVLGEHQDSLLAQTTLRDLGVAAHLAGENGFSFGRLHTLEEHAAQVAIERYAAALAEAATPSIRRWLG
jgi:CHAD domain-containing protein